MEKANFIPAPKIDSSVLYFKKKDTYDIQEAKQFLKVTSAGFSAPRKKVISNLANTLHISKEILQEVVQKLELLETVRAEEIGIEKWKQFIGHIAK